MWGLDVAIQHRQQSLVNQRPGDRSRDHRVTGHVSLAGFASPVLLHPAVGTLAGTVDLIVGL